MAGGELEVAKRIFSENLRYYMQKCGKSQADISADLGITASTVSDWVNGKKYARVDKMRRLADYFGVRISDLREKKPSAENYDGYGQNGEGYETDEETREIIKSFKLHPEMKILFSASKDATREDILKAVKIIKALNDKSGEP